MYRYLATVLVLSMCCNVAFVMCDYSCFCNYAQDAEVHETMDITSRILGYMSRLECKPISASATTDGSWVAIEFKHEIGYVHEKSRVINCPGNPSTTDTVTTRATTPLRTTSTATMSIMSTQLPFYSSAVTTTDASTTTTSTYMATTRMNTSFVTTKTSSIESTRATSTTTAVTPRKEISSSTVATTMHTQSTTGMNSPIITTASIESSRATATTVVAHPTTEISSSIAATTVHTQMPIRCSDAVKFHAEAYHGVTLFQGSTCLELVTYSSDWESAENNCATRGGHLVDILSQSDEDMVVSFLHSYHVTGNVWIGLNDRANENTFVWSSGHPLTYKHWISGINGALNVQFAHIVHDCVALVPDFTVAFISRHIGEWDDFSCSENHPYICRFEHKTNQEVIVG